MKKYLIILVLASISIPSFVWAINITVPSSSGFGYALVSTSTGAYISTTTSPLHVGSIYASSTSATSTFLGNLGVGSSALKIFATGGVGVGADPNVLYSLNALGTLYSAGFHVGEGTFDGTKLIYSYSLAQADADQTAVYGYRYQYNSNNTNMLTGVYGRADTFLLGVGNTTAWLTGIVGQVSHGSNGTVTNAAALYAKAPATGGGTLTNSYGLYLESNTAGTNPYSIYSNGGQSYFSGNIGLSSTTPFANLAVNPTAGAASNKFVVGSSTATSFLITNAGRVGIGTTSPSATLAVTGVLGQNPIYISTTTATVASTTLFAVDQAGWAHFGGGTPVLSSCGTTPLLDANSTDQTGTITFGATASGCTLTFSVVAPTSPHCTVTPRAISLVNAYTVAPTTAGIVITQAASGGTVWDFWCPLGH